MQNTAIQHKRQYDWLKQYQFQKGQSGNPSGKNGKSAKQFAREMLLSMADENKAEFLKTLDPEIVWRMAEGNPHNTDTVVTMTISDVLKDLEDGNKAIRQNLENEQSLPIEGQAETINTVPAQQSPEPLRPAQVVEKYNPQV